MRLLRVILRRSALALTGAALLAAVSAPSAVADPVTRCSLSDPRLDEVSGLVASADGLKVVNDSGNATVVYTLGADCQVVSTRPSPIAGKDVEDLAQAADGTLWLADIGDNGSEAMRLPNRDGGGFRPSIQIIRLGAGDAADAVQLVYPDGGHDAETMILPADGRPVIVTKSFGQPSGVYTTDAPLPALGRAGSTPVVLRKVGEIDPPKTHTEGGPVGWFGGGLVTGGALSPDGRVVAVRTYLDAWLAPVSSNTADGVVAALTGGRPTAVALPNEPQGEAVAFSADGTLLSAGESPAATATMPGGTGQVRAVAGAEQLVAPAVTASAAVPAATPVATPVATAGAVVGTSSAPTTTWVAAGAVAVVAAAGLGVVALRRHRGAPRPGARRDGSHRDG